MADIVNVGAAANDNLGDLLRDAFRKVNARFNELLGTIEGGQPWATATAYTATPVRQWVVESGQAYIATVNHTSSAVFADDLAAGKWAESDSAQILIDIAGIGPGKGDSIVGSSDGSSGAKWTTLAGYIAYLRDTLGAVEVGTADGRTVQQRLDALISEVDAAGTAALATEAHNHNPAAHPELTDFVTDEANRAEAAVNAALIQAGVYVDEATGRAAVADGVAFKVQGSGDVAAFEYRRVNSGSSTLIATYPAAAAVARTYVGGGVNKFDPASVLVGYEIHATLGVSIQATSIVSGLIYVEGQAAVSVSGMQANTGQYRRFAFYSADGITEVQNGFFALNANAGVIPVPSGAVWFRFCPKQRVADAADYSTLMCEWGDAVSAYEAYTDPRVITVGGKRLQIPPLKIERFGKKNQFKASAVRAGYEIHSSLGVTAQADSSVSGLMSVDGWTYVTLSGLQTQAVLGRYYEFLAEDQTTVVLRSQLATGATGGTLAVPVGASWFRFCPKQRNTDAASYGAIQVEQGQFATAFEAFTPVVGRINGERLAGGSSASATPATGAKYLMFGDSITETATVDNSGSYTEGTRSNWPKFAMTTLGASIWANYAKSGATFREYVGQSDFQKISHQITRAGIDARLADVIIVAAGTNDGTANLGNYTTAMGRATLGDLDRSLTIEAMRWAFWTIRTTWPAARCYAMLPIQRADLETSDRQTLLDAISQMARRYNFVLIDAHNESNIVKDFEVVSAAGRDLYDGLHPSVSGQQKMAALVVSKLSSTL
jgi:lysophospholipase L1-like esterase